ncbi:hypothetical protein BDV59DRAFT_201659 [Aspergillus ambiguus]|uniref:uncharacterized protein n=1 Tax=Aspergillus ambiguus TaxID=176160 RepID=UPI003CCDA6EB
MDNPYGLARPACTLGDWTQSSVCHDYCSEVDEALTTGCTLVLIHNEKNIAEYCPNSIIDNWEGNTGCADNATRFTLGPFYSIPNTGYLSNASFSGDSAADNANSITGNSTLATSSDPADHCAGQSTLAAVGAGVGVPLGLICLVSVGYAYYVKRKRFNQEMMRPLPQIQEPPLAYDKPVATVVEPQELPVIVGRELDSTPTSRNHL